MGFPDLASLGLGHATLQVGTGSTPTAAAGTYDALKSGVIVSLTVGEKITPNAAIVLGRTFTLADINSLWEDFDISDDETYRLITGQDPPTVRDMALYGAWMQSPFLNVSAGPAVPTYQVTPLAQSDTFKVSNHLRGRFDIELRPRLPADADVFPPPGPTLLDDGIIPVVQSHQLFIGAKGSDGKRDYRATGALLRFYDTNLQALSAGAFEYRYVLRLAKK